jgi:hypothetical protein
MLFEYLRSTAQAGLKCLPGLVCVPGLVCLTVWGTASATYAQYAPAGGYTYGGYAQSVQPHTTAMSSSGCCCCQVQPAPVPTPAVDPRPWSILPKHLAGSGGGAIVTGSSPRGSVPPPQTGGPGPSGSPLPGPGGSPRGGSGSGGGGGTGSGSDTDSKPGREPEPLTSDEKDPPPPGEDPPETDERNPPPVSEPPPKDPIPVSTWFHIPKTPVVCPPDDIPGDPRECDPPRDPRDCDTPPETPGETPVVPEPGSLVLLLIAGTFGGAQLWRKRRSG